MTVNNTDLQSAGETVSTGGSLTAAQLRAITAAIEHGDDEQFSKAINIVRKSESKTTSPSGSSGAVLPLSDLTTLRNALTKVINKRDEPNRRQQAAYVLGSIGRELANSDTSKTEESRALKTLAATATSDPDATVRRNAINAISRIAKVRSSQVEPVFNALLTTLDDTNDWVATEGERALAVVADSQPEVLTGKHHEIRSLVNDGALSEDAVEKMEKVLDVFSSGELTDTDDDIMNAADSRDHSDRAQTLHELARNEPEAAADHIDELCELLRDTSEWQTRSKAARAVGHVATEDTARAADAVDDLSTLYKDARGGSDDDVGGNQSTARANALFAIARVAKHGRRKAVIPEISTVAEALDDDHDRVRNNAAWSFRYVANNYPLEVASWWDSLAQVLFQIDDQHQSNLTEKTVQGLTEALQRVAATDVDKLTEAVEPSIATLFASLDKEDDETASLALHALEQLAEDQSRIGADANELIDQLDSAELAIQFYAVRAIGRVGDETAVEPLRDLANRTDDNVIEAAAEDALARLDAEPVDAAETSTETRPATSEAASTRGPPDQIPSPSVPSIDLTEIELIREIDHGGTAVVHKGRYVRGDDEVSVAVKRPLFSGNETISAETGRDLLKEGEVWERLDRHDHVVDVLAVGMRDGQPWLATEYMDGGTLADRAGEIPLSEGLWIIERLASALHYVHWNCGVTHLDMKPSNVLFRRVEDSWNVPKIADWGLSRQSLDLTTSVYGVTPQYAAPEQQPLTDGDLSPKTDIYQLGVIAYELLVGEPPFIDQDDILAYHRDEARPPTPSEVDSTVPSAFDDLVQTAMALDPEDRFATDQHLLEAAQSIRVSLDE